MPSTTDPQLTVWVTACLGKQLSAKEDETIDTSAGTTLCLKQGAARRTRESMTPFGK